MKDKISAGTGVTSTQPSYADYPIGPIDLPFAVDPEKTDEPMFKTLPQAEGLSAAQRMALTAIAGGRTHTQAAALAGVDRSTLYRWYKISPAFVAAVNAWRDHTLNCAQDRLLGAVDQAVSAVIASLGGGDVRTALVLLKSMGALTAPVRGPVQPEVAEKAILRDGIVESLDLLRAVCKPGSRSSN